MKLSLMALISLMAASCGNPHISTVTSGLEKTNPPLSSEEAVCAPSPAELKFFFGRHAEGQLIESTKCREAITETFMPFPDGPTTLVTNHNYEITHRAERDHRTEKAVYLDDIFGLEDYPMEILMPVAQNGIKGKDRGLDSLNADDETKDALIWSFSSPISFWGARMINLRSLPSQPAMLRIFNCEQLLIKESKIIFPHNEQGADEYHFIGVSTPGKDICHISVTVGDHSSSLAIDEFLYGK